MVSPEQSTNPASTPSSLLAGFAIVPCLGIVCLRLFAMEMPTLGATDTAWFILQPLTVLAILLVERRVSYSGRTVAAHLIAASVAMAAGGVLSIALPQGWTLVLGSLLRSVCSAILLMGIGYYLCSIRMHLAVLSIVAGFAASAVMAQILTLLPDNSQLPLATAFALCVGPCLVGGLKSAPHLPRAAQTPSLPFKKVVAELPWTTWIILPVSILFLFRTSHGSSDWVSFVVPFIGVGLYALLLAAVLVWILALRRDDPDVMLPPLIFALFFGTMFTVAFDSFFPDLSQAVYQAISKCYLLIVWIYLVSVVEHTDLPALAVFGIGNVILAQLPRILRLFVEPILASVDMSFLTVAGSAVVFAIAIALYVVLANRMRTLRVQPADTIAAPQSSADVPVATAAPVKPSVQDILNELPLTPRETEVASYLARGYSLPEIGKTLVLSTETVRTHCKNIYRKADVHSKQEFIKMIERGGVPMPEGVDAESAEGEE